MTLFHLWNLPGDVLAAPESALGLDRCNLSLSLSYNVTIYMSWQGVMGYLAIASLPIFLYTHLLALVDERH